MAVSSWGPVNQSAALARHGNFGATEIAVVLSGHDLLDVPLENGPLIPYRLTKPVGAIGDAIESVAERIFRGEDTSASLPFEQRKAVSLLALDKIVYQAEEFNSSLLFVYNATTDERKSGTSDYGRLLFRWAERHGIKTVDLGAVPDISYRDHIHPDANGAARIAQALSEEYLDRAKCR